MLETARLTFCPVATLLERLSLSEPDAEGHHTDVLSALSVTDDKLSLTISGSGTMSNGKVD